jgi:hypothetical protein
MRVREVMRPLDETLVVRPGDNVFRSLEKASARTRRPAAPCATPAAAPLRRAA